MISLDLLRKDAGLRHSWRPLRLKRF